MSESPSSEGLGGEVDGPLVLETWNVSSWTKQRLSPISTLRAQLLALQETRLGPLPLEHARSALRRQEYTLHHGAASSAVRAGGHADTAGVGFLAMPGIAVSPLPPRGAAWRRLHAMARLHGAVFPPRPGLPLGLRVFSVYAPLSRAPLRAAFDGTFIDFVSELNMQLPTLLMGGFHGSVAPERDYSSGSGAVCHLLTRLLDPGGPFIDLQLSSSPVAWAFTFTMPHLSSLTQSRCDLVLGNRAVLGLVQRVWVASHVMAKKDSSAVFYNEGVNPGQKEIATAEDDHLWCKK